MNLATFLHTLNMRTKRGNFFSFEIIIEKMCDFDVEMVALRQHWGDESKIKTFWDISPIPGMYAYDNTSWLMIVLLRRLLDPEKIYLKLH